MPGLIVARYRFITEWEFDAPLPLAWSAILNSQDWPKWWPGVLAVTPVKPGAGTGDVRRYAMRSALPYTLEFDMEVTEIVPRVRLAGRARGEVAGTGVWTFAPLNGAVDASEERGCRLRYEWHVRTVPLWMNLLAPFARPLIKWNHDRIMVAGARGLARHLQAQLLAQTNRTCEESA